MGLVAVAGLENVLRMEVSKTKSVVVATQPKIAVAIADGVVSGKVKRVFHAKGLGADIVGGGKRSTVQQRKRLKVFNNKRPAFHSIRQAGGDTRQMARAVGPPGALYSTQRFGAAQCQSLRRGERILGTGACHCWLRRKLWRLRWRSLCC